MMCIDYYADCNYNTFKFKCNLIHAFVLFYGFG